MYKALLGTNDVLRIEDEAQIPADPKNKDWKAFQKWLDGGGKLLPADEPPVPIPQQVTRAQGKAVLIQRGLWPTVIAFVEGIPDPEVKAIANVAIHDTLHWERQSPYLQSIAKALEWSDATLDQLFLEASRIQL